MCGLIAIKPMAVPLPSLRHRSNFTQEPGGEKNT
jgi:hypothetical protein